MKKSTVKQLDAMLTRYALDTMASVGAEEWLSSEVRLQVMEGEAPRVSWMVTTELDDHRAVFELSKEQETAVESLGRDAAAMCAVPWDAMRFRLLSDGSYDYDFSFEGRDIASEHLDHSM